MSQKICINKTCSHKGNPQDINNFYRDLSKKDNHQDWCKDCMKVVSRAYEQKRRAARDQAFNMIM